jgi:hypothetical protein
LDATTKRGSPRRRPKPTDTRPAIRKRSGTRCTPLAWTEYRQHFDIAASPEILDRALAVVGDDPQTNDLRLLLLTNAAVNLNDLGRPAQAQRTLGQALILPEQVGTPPRLGCTTAGRADRLLLGFLG